MKDCEHCGGLGVLTDREFGGMDCPICGGAGEYLFSKKIKICGLCQKEAEYTRVVNKKRIYRCENCYLKETKK